MNNAEFNKGTGFYKTFSALDSIIWAANIPIAIIGFISFALNRFQIAYSLPAWIGDYNYGIQLAINAILILVLDNGHSRYYAIYINHDQLTAVGNTLDLSIKIVLLVTSIVQIVVADSIVYLCLMAYVLTFFRNKELLSTLDKDNPLYVHIASVWLPNNIRHNLTMLLFNICFYSVKFKLIYFASGWLMDLPIDPQIFQNEKVCLLHDCVVHTLSLFFSVYWIQRVLRKIKITKNTFFQMEPMKKLSKSLEDYYENKSDR